MRRLTIGNDASWAGWGHCLADQNGPLQVGHLALGPPNKRANKTKRNPNPQLLPTHRTARLDAYLRGPMSWLLSDAKLMRRPGDPPVRVAVEIPPLGFKKGQPSAYLQLGRIIGPIETWGCRPDLLYPWAMEPEAWRFWWGIAKSGRGRGSPEIKADAIAVVERNWGASWLAKFNRTKIGGPMADVAEAILIAVGCSKNPQHAPQGPQSWPETPEGTWFTP